MKMNSLGLQSSRTVLSQTVFPSQLQQEHQKALLRRDFQLQSLGLQARLQQKLWSQERTLLVQESQHLKQALLLLSLKLRCFLKQWRLGCKKDTEWKDILEVWGGGKCPTASVRVISWLSVLLTYLFMKKIFQLGCGSKINTPLKLYLRCLRLLKPQLYFNHCFSCNYKKSNKS